MYQFLKGIFESRKLLWTLTKSDISQKYFGSLFGIGLLFIQSISTILILWFVFQVGFKAQPIDDTPFVLWLITGLLPWFFISDSISSSTNSITESSYLVKKIVFQVNILPIIKLISAFLIHSFFKYFYWRYKIIVSKQLDINYYLATYPDVALSGDDPIMHYVKFGARENRDPNKFFNTKTYLLNHPEVDTNKMNPLIFHIDKANSKYFIHK